MTRQATGSDTRAMDSRIVCIDLSRIKYFQYIHIEFRGTGPGRSPICHTRGTLTRSARHASRPVRAAETVCCRRDVVTCRCAVLRRARSIRIEDENTHKHTRTYTHTQCHMYTSTSRFRIVFAKRMQIVPSLIIRAAVISHDLIHLNPARWSS